MHEYGKDKNSSNQSGGSITSNSFITTSSTPRIKRVTVTETVYDEEGRVVKETTTETEYEDHTWTSPVYPYPYQPYWTSGTTWTGGTLRNDTE